MVDRISDIVLAPQSINHCFRTANDVQKLLPHFIEQLYNKKYRIYFWDTDGQMHLPNNNS